MNPHNSIEETQSEEKKCPGCGEPGCLCWKELLKEQDEELHTCHSPQSVQKEELWQEFKKKYKGVYWNEDDRLWLDSIVDRISASVREETLKEARTILGSARLDWFNAKLETFSGQDEAEHCIENILSEALSALQKLSD